jgi:hypothetical protein
MPPANARRRTTHAAATRAAATAAPAAPRRVSGPIGPRAVPAPRPLPRRGATVGVPAVGERLRALGDHRFIDRLLRSRAWIWIVGILLGGIVAMQVSLLKLNTGISRAVETTSTLQRENSTLEARIAKLSSTDRIQDRAAALGMVMPPAGEVGYLTARPLKDARKAAATMTAPSEDALAVMANGGRAPGTVVTTDPATSTPTTTTSTTTAGTTAATGAATTTTTTTPTTTTTDATGTSGATGTTGTSTTTDPGTTTSSTDPTGATTTASDTSTAPLG